MAKRRDGFSDDGLSYSVAGDLDKLLGQSLSSYEARTKNPRGLHESPEEYQQRVSTAPSILNDELSAIGISMPRRSASASPRTFEIGNELVQVDPISGASKVVFKGSAPAAMSPQEKLTRDNAYSERRTIMGKLVPSEEEEARLAQLNKMIAAWESGGAPAVGKSRGLLPDDQIDVYLKKANGDQVLAEKLAQDDGWETRY